jgi:hypothetical protein
MYVQPSVLPGDVTMDVDMCVRVVRGKTLTYVRLLLLDKYLTVAILTSWLSSTTR